MIADISVYRWQGYQFDWEQVLLYKKVELRQFDSRSLYIGGVVVFDVPNGDDWSSFEKGCDRYHMEAFQTGFYGGDITLEGFVHVEHYGERHPTEQGDPERTAFTKQRWVVKIRK